MGNENNPAPGGIEKAPVDVPLSVAIVATSAVTDTGPKPITFEDFLKVDIRVGKILTCERVPKSKKLVKMEVEFDAAIGKRVILAGIADHAEFSVDLLINHCCLFVVNLAPREMMGIQSHGMMIGAKDVDGLYRPATCGTPFGTLGAKVG
jgi:methionyl-tRNA synthetase